MSAETYAAVETALRDHFADEMSGAYLTDWRVICAGVGEEADSTYYQHIGSNSGLHIGVGLLALANANLMAGYPFED